MGLEMVEPLVKLSSDTIWCNNYAPMYLLNGCENIYPHKNHEEYKYTYI